MTVLEVGRLSDDWMAIFRSMTKFSWIEQADIEAALGVKWDKLPRRICSAANFRNVLRASGRVQFNKETWGIPQGSPISAVFFKHLHA